MKHSASRLRGAATRRRVMDAVVDFARQLTTDRSTPATLATVGVSRRARSLPAPVAMQQRRSGPPIVRMPPPPRTSADFTARVMERVATTPPGPDPREARVRRSRAHMRRLAHIYLALIILSGAALVAMTVFAPWMLLAGLAAIVSAALLLAGLGATISDATDGMISGFGVAWIAMLAALVPLLWLMARQATHGRKPPARGR